MTRKIIAILVYVLCIQTLVGQEYDSVRIAQLENRLTVISTEVPGLSEKLDITMQQATLSTFLLAISEVHNINIDVDPELQGVQIFNNFKEVLVSDVLVYLSKNYNLTIDFTGNILFISILEEEVEIPEERVIPLAFNPNDQTLSVDLKNDNLAEAFKLISDASGKGLFYTPDLNVKTISAFIKELPFDIAMEKIAYSNDLLVSRSKDGSYEFESATPQAASGANGTAVTRPARSRRSNFFFKVIDLKEKRLDVDIQNAAIADVIYDIGNELGINIFTASPLESAGAATVKAKDISFDQLLTKIFENTALTYQGSTGSTAQNNANRGGQNGQQSSSTSERFTFKKEGDIYYFGTFKQLTLRASEIVSLRYRSIGILDDPQSPGRTAGRSNSSFGFNGNVGINGNFGNNTTNTRQNQNTNQSSGRQNKQNSNGSDLSALIPEDIKQDLNIIADMELNSFIVSGASADIQRFKDFVKQIDKAVPIVIIEVMILEVSRNSTLDAGIEWGIGSEPTTTQGSLFPETNLNLGAGTINRILGRIDGSSFFNIGQVGPNFFANIRASESNGNFKIKSSPRITTLNGHRAYFSNGRTSYFEVTQNQFLGTQNPVVSESTNFVPIDAELSLEVLPFVSADGEVTMDIKVIQSSFTGDRITETGPPEISSREFTSIIKSRTDDIVVLGGLEEDRKSNSGSGIPFLARIPIIKWLFSTRVRTASKSKLTVLIKPTVIY